MILFVVCRAGIVTALRASGIGLAGRLVHDPGCAGTTLGQHRRGAHVELARRPYMAANVALRQPRACLPAPVPSQGVLKTRPAIPTPTAPREQSWRGFGLPRQTRHQPNCQGLGCGTGVGRLVGHAAGQCWGGDASARLFERGVFGRPGAVRSREFRARPATALTRRQPWPTGQGRGRRARRRYHTPGRFIERIVASQSTAQLYK